MERITREELRNAVIENMERVQAGIKEYYDMLNKYSGLIKEIEDTGLIIKNKYYECEAKEIIKCRNNKLFMYGFKDSLMDDLLSEKNTEEVINQAIDDVEVAIDRCYKVTKNKISFSMYGAYSDYLGVSNSKITKGVMVACNLFKLEEPSSMFKYEIGLNNVSDKLNIKIYKNNKIEIIIK